MFFHVQCSSGGSMNELLLRQSTKQRLVHEFLDFYRKKAHKKRITYLAIARLIEKCSVENLPFCLYQGHQTPGRFNFKTDIIDFFSSKEMQQSLPKSVDVYNITMTWQKHVEEVKRD